MPAKWVLFNKQTWGKGKYRAYLDRLSLLSLSRGVMLLSPKLRRQLGGPEAVLLMYDSGRQRIGIRPVDKTDPQYLSAHKVTYGNKGANMDTVFASIACRAFINKYRILEGSYSSITVENGITSIDATDREALQINN